MDPGIPGRRLYRRSGASPTAATARCWPRSNAAPREVRRGSVRTMAAGLMRHDRAPPGVRAFAQRVGALA
ncbi:hypothetical protein GCM10010390_89000 [Streptomyces mordarskii]|uniref:Uncharacterized protein n=1 Tax=Streptomyces mordarskii TaxID=1226758 RepID=A0ABN1EQW2_9ACTN